jgi:hypothetical protein
MKSYSASVQADIAAPQMDKALCLSKSQVERLAFHL